MYSLTGKVQKKKKKKIHQNFLTVRSHCRLWMPKFKSANMSLSYTTKFWCCRYYRISSVIRRSVFLPIQSQRSRSILQDRSRSFGLFRKGKIGIIAKFHRTDLVIWSHSRGTKTLSYSQIHMVSVVQYHIYDQPAQIQIIQWQDKMLKKLTIKVQLFKTNNVISEHDFTFYAPEGTSVAY